MKPLLIRYWHGRPSPEQHGTWLKKLDAIAFAKPGLDANIYFDGTLDQFAAAWNEKFLYYPPTDSEKEFISGTIWLTPWGSWGAR